MVELFWPSVFEDFAYATILKHAPLHGPLHKNQEESLKQSLARLGMIERDGSPSRKGAMFARELQQTYPSLAKSDPDDERLDDFFLIDGRPVSLLPVQQKGPKPVLFQYSIPDPVIEGDGRELLFHLSHNFTTLSRELFDLLSLSLYDNDSYPNDFWLVQRGKESFLGRTITRLHEEVQPGDRFVCALTNRNVHALLIHGVVESNREYAAKLDVYASRAEGLPYVDLVKAITYKLKPLLRILGQEDAFDLSKRRGMEAEVNQFKNLPRYRRLRDPYAEPISHELPPFYLKPVGTMKIRFVGRRPIIGIFAMKQPSFANRIPLLASASPWFAYVGHGTLDDDLVGRKLFRFWHVRILELDEVILSTLVVSR